MIFWKQSPTPGMPFPIVGHSYQFMVPQEDIWSTAESIIAKCDKQQRKVSLKSIYSIQEWFNTGFLGHFLGIVGDWTCQNIEILAKFGHESP